MDPTPTPTAKIPAQGGLGVRADVWTVCIYLIYAWDVCVILMSVIDYAFMARG